jgi:hypothetical protein
MDIDAFLLLLFERFSAVSQAKYIYIYIFFGIFFRFFDMIKTPQYRVYLLPYVFTNLKKGEQSKMQWQTVVH